MALFQSVPEPASILEIFLQRYANLLRFAESLTRDRREAEDLVQDACVRLLLSPPDSSQVVNVDAYLMASLRNLHLTRTRRRQLRPEAQLSIVDFDSAGLALEALSHASSLHARDALRRACSYACARRFSSKTASFFILHFFHGYVPAEIATIAQLRRPSINTGLTRGRVEVRAYLDDPDAALRAVGLSAVPDCRVDRAAAADGDDYVARLRAAIFALRHARCFDALVLRRLYADTATPIPAETLAQLVTCPRCLDAMNRATRLPILAERHPRARQDDEGPPRFAITSGQTRRLQRLSAEQTARTIRAHQPRALRVLVNGFEIGSHHVTAPVTRATHALSGPEPPRIVEVCSDQHICLVTLHVETVPDAAVAQHTAIALDEGRRLELSVLFDAQWPTLQLTYLQPAEVWAVDQDWDEDASMANDAPTFGAMAQPVASLWERVTQALHGRVSRRRALRLAGVMVMLWLLFFTPGASVSAAELAYRTLMSIVASAWQRLHPAPPVIPARQWPPVLREYKGVAPSSTPARPTVHLPPPIKQWTALERSQAEIRALASLQRIEAYLGQEIRLGSGRHGRARVDAVVSDVTRRAELVAALKLMQSDGTLDITVLTHDEAATRVSRQPASAPGLPLPAQVSGPSASPDLRVYEFERDRIAAADILRKHFGDQQAVRDFANDMLDRSRRASLHAWSLQHLTARFDASLAVRLPAADRDVLGGLIVQHAREFDHEVEVLATALAPIFAVGEREDVAAPDAEDVWTLVQQLLELNRVRDEAVQRTLVVGRTSNPGPGLASPAFWDALEASRRVARLLRRQPRLSLN